LFQRTSGVVQIAIYLFQRTVCSIFTLYYKAILHSGKLALQCGRKPFYAQLTANKVMSDKTTSSATEAWQIRKPAKSGSAGMVASQHYAASDLGVEVLNAGGNAIDAAVATSLMIGTVEPWMSGLGGGGCMLYYDAETKQAHAIDFGMRASRHTDPLDYPLSAGQDNDLFGWPSVLEQRNVHGPLSIATPGYLAGIALALRRFGTLDFAELVTPAIQTAKQGMSIDWYATLKIAAAASTLNQYTHSAETYLPEGFPPAGEWGGPLPNIVLGKLADTLQTLQLQGPQDFYHGDIAQSLVADATSHGSKICAQDLSEYTARVLSADSHQYREATVFSMPGVSAGPTLADALQRLEQTWRQHGQQLPDAATYSAYANALQNAYNNRLTTMGDVDDSQAPSCTTHITTMDKAGNMVALRTHE